MNHTVLSATHMVDISLRDPGGGEMVKVRLQGTKEESILENILRLIRTRIKNKKGD